MRIFRARGMQEHYIVHDPCISLSLSLFLSLFISVFPRTRGDVSRVHYCAQAKRRKEKVLQKERLDFVSLSLNFVSN